MSQAVGQRPGSLRLVILSRSGEAVGYPDRIRSPPVSSCLLAELILYYVDLLYLFHACPLSLISCVLCFIHHLILVNRLQSQPDRECKWGLFVSDADLSFPPRILFLG